MIKLLDPPYSLWGRHAVPSVGSGRWRLRCAPYGCALNFAKGSGNGKYRIRGDTARSGLSFGSAWRAAWKEGVSGVVCMSLGDRGPSGSNH